MKTKPFTLSIENSNGEFVYSGSFKKAKAAWKKGHSPRLPERDFMVLDGKDKRVSFGSDGEIIKWEFEPKFSKKDKELLGLSKE